MAYIYGTAISNCNDILHHPIHITSPKAAAQTSFKHNMTDIAVEHQPGQYLSLLSNN
jgi:hypothetical protein